MKVNTFIWTSLALFTAAARAFSSASCALSASSAATAGFALPPAMTELDEDDGEVEDEEDGEASGFSS